MLRRFSPRLLSMQFVTDLLLTLLAVKVAEQARIHVTTHFEQRQQYLAVHPGVYVLVLCVWTSIFLLLGTYDASRREWLPGDLANLWLSVSLAMLVLASLFYLLWPQPEQAPSRLFYVYFFAMDVLLLSAEHIFVFQVLSARRRRGKNMRRVLLVGGGVLGRHVAVRLRGRQTAGVNVVGYLSGPDEPPVPDLARLGDRTDVLHVVEEQRVEEVVVALPAEAHLQALDVAAALEPLPVQVRILPDVFDVAAMKARIEDFYGLPLISIREPSMNPVQVRIKRAFDIVVSALLLLLSLPFAVAIAIAVRLSSPGPVFIHQRRVGAGGRPFYMHKFRSMIWNPEELERGFAKRPADPRVTSVGKHLRRTSLDELPQLWNVLRGEMSLVGPRPELPAVVEGYEPWQRKRFNVPPGMTGWWQVNGRSERSMHLNTEVDLYYVQNYSIMLDLQILLRTLGAVVRGRGAF